MVNIEKKAISAQVLSYLRKEIMLNHLKAGHHLKEKDISDYLQVSRGPVREAFTQLENEKLVEKRLNGRTVVRGYRQKDIEDLYRARMLLEQAALAEIDLKVFQENMDRFHYYIQEMKNTDEKNEADMDFHKLIMKLSDNIALEQLWTSLHGMVQTLMEITNEYLAIRQKEAIHEHIAIIENMDKGNVDGAQYALEKHLKGAAVYYANAVNEITQGRQKLDGK